MGVKLLLLSIVILQQFGTFTTAEKYSDMYPDISNCIGIKNQEAPEWINELYSNAKANCKIGEDQDETSLCFKVCVLNERLIMFKEEHKYSLYGSTAAEGLGLFFSSESDSVEEILSQARERLYACDPASYTIPESDEKDCKDWDPKHRETIQKMVTCVEDAVKC